MHTSAYSVAQGSTAPYQRRKKNPPVCEGNFHGSVTTWQSTDWGSYLWRERTRLCWLVCMTWSPCTAKGSRKCTPTLRPVGHWCMLCSSCLPRAANFEIEVMHHPEWNRKRPVRRKLPSWCRSTRNLTGSKNTHKVFSPLKIALKFNFYFNTKYFRDPCVGMN